MDGRKTYVLQFLDMTSIQRLMLVWDVFGGGKGMTEGALLLVVTANALSLALLKPNNTSALG